MNNQRPVFIVLTGLPASGKSTLRKALEASWRAPGLVACSTDDYLEAVANRDDIGYQRAYKEHSTDAAKFMQHRISVALSGARDILVDRTHLTTDARRRIRANVPSIYTEISILCACDPDERKQRDAGRGERMIPDHVIETMRGFAVAPAKDEGFDLRLTDWDVMRDGELIDGPLSEYYTHSV